MKVEDKRLIEIVLKSFKTEIELSKDEFFENSCRMFKAEYSNYYVVLRSIKNENMPEVSFLRSDRNIKKVFEDYEIGINFYPRNMDDFKRLFVLIAA